MRLSILLKRLYACEDAIKWANNRPFTKKTWDACNRPDWIMWLADELKIDSKKVARALAACIDVYSPVRNKDAKDVAKLLRKWAKNPKSIKPSEISNLDRKFCEPFLKIYADNFPVENCLAVEALRELRVATSNTSRGHVYFANVWNVITPSVIAGPKFKLGANVVKKYIKWSDIKKNAEDYLMAREK